MYLVCFGALPHPLLLPLCMCVRVCVLYIHIYICTYIYLSIHLSLTPVHHEVNKSPVSNAHAAYCSTQDHEIKQLWTGPSETMGQNEQFLIESCSLIGFSNTKVSN